MIEENKRIRFCINCGSPLGENAKFCVNCGWKVQLPEINTPEPETKPAQEPVVPAEPVVNVEEEPKAPVTEPAAPAPEQVPPAAPSQEAPREKVNAGAGYYGVPVNNTTGYGNSFEQELRNYNNVTDRYRDRDYRPVNPNAQKTAEAPKKRMPGWAIALIIVGAVIAVVIVISIIANFFLGALRDLGKNIGKYLPDLNYSTEAPAATAKPGDDVKVGDETVPSGSNVTINITGDSESLAAAVYAKASDSVVGISILTTSSTNPWADTTYTVVGQGSGVVFKSDGYIITNCHVVSGTLDKDNKPLGNYQIRVYVDTSLSTYFEAEIVGVDYTSDLAVLKINAKGLKAIEFASSSEVAIGDQVFLIGCPGGIEFMRSITSGIVGGLNKNFLTSDGYAYDLIQSDAAINPGTSGGAMLNSKGQLIGICEMKIVDTGYEGMGFAISSDTVKQICDALMKDGKVTRPAVGITVNTTYDVTSASDAGLPAGAWIEEVEKDSPAWKAGLRSGMIITEFNGNAVYNFVSLRAEIMKCEIGEEVEIKAYVFDSSDKANGQYKTFKVTLQSLEDEHRDFN
ncbi:MAG: trypsin-like peptidase domain-containing protein [Clostridia bacterium]|nr:trypsin-like peptidase domain-containing protein [Clostridia bacterium]